MDLGAEEPKYRGGSLFVIFEHITWGLSHFYFLNDAWEVFPMQLLWGP